jgi:hypothetical protein
VARRLPRTSFEQVLWDRRWIVAIEAYDQGEPRYLAKMFEEAPTISEEARKAAARIIRSGRAKSKPGRPALSRLKIDYARAMLETIAKVEREHMKTVHAQAEANGSEPCDLRDDIRRDTHRKKAKLAASLGVTVATLKELRKSRSRNRG